MTVIETKKEVSSNSPQKLFDFLTDMNNFEALMPEGKVEKWNSEKDQCEFTIKGMARIGLKIVDTESPNRIQIESFGKVPFPFTLEICLDEKDNEGSEVYMTFKGEINAFMKMMVEKPLRNFFNMLVEKAATLSL
ncbi:MAG: SRPBCC family protein [Vicingaceae bacterium]